MQEDTNDTPVHYAAKDDRVEAVALLVQEGADIHAVDGDGYVVHSLFRLKLIGNVGVQLS